MHGVIGIYYYQFEKEEIRKKRLQSLSVSNTWLENIFSNILPEKGYEIREEQFYFGLHINTAIANKEWLLAEIGVGVGKTFAYLLPGLRLALNTGKPLIISTATIALQEQIFYNDIPVMESILDKEFSKSIAMGRDNYVCIERIRNPKLGIILEEKGFEKKLAGDILKTYRNSEDGNRRDFPDLPPIIWELMHSGEGAPCSECSQAECSITRVREKFKKARHIVVCNHNWFFANLQSISLEKGSLFQMPSAIVLDEGHATEAAAQSIYGMEIALNSGTNRIQEAQKFSRYDIYSDLTFKVQVAKDTFKKFFALLIKNLIGQDDEEASRYEVNLSTGLVGFINKLNGLLIKLTEELISYTAWTYEGRGKAILRTADKIQEIQAILSCMLQPDKYIIWVERIGRYGKYVLKVLPKNISHELKENFKIFPVPIIICSATLSVEIDKKPDYEILKKSLGIEVAKTCNAKSPFKYKKNALIYIARDLPEPTAKIEFLNAVAERIKELILLSSGRALVLFTSHYSLNYVYENLKEKLPYKIYHQNQGSSSSLVEKFRKDTNSVLCGTGTYWEGIDVPGESLSLVILVKLPFPADDPLLKSKVEDAIKAGEDPFKTVRLPHMLLKLKQGAGRLIRRDADRGVIAVLDRRAIEKSYKEQVVNALPPAPRTSNLEDVQNFFNA